MNDGEGHPAPPAADGPLPLQVETAGVPVVRGLRAEVRDRIKGGTCAMVIASARQLGFPGRR